MKCSTQWIMQSQEREETVTFLDETVGTINGWSVPEDPIVQDDSITAAQLADFMARPVRISTIDWSMTDTFGQFKSTIRPWTLFLSNVRVARKLANFAFLRGNLKLKFVINGSPFYYGAMKAIYQPLPNFTVSTINSPTPQALMPYSQRPGTWLRPGRNEGGEMTLPFFWPKNWFAYQVDDPDNLGVLDYVIYSVLRSANAAVSQNVTISTYAWIEDLELSGSTVLPQSSEQDEYGDGPVSRPATVVADAAAKLAGVPVIGKFATATEIGARAVAHVAKLFGYTNVPVIEDAHPFRPAPFPQLASCDIGYPVEKLTIDSKNELSVDPRALGLSSDDELSLSSFTSRESWVTNFTWNVTDAVDTLLFTSRVTPLMLRVSSNAINGHVDQTPMSMAATLFKYWRGDIIFHFRFIRSDYHRGRVRISFDPLGNTTTNIVNTAETSNAVFTQIVDLEETDDVEVRLPYQQALAYLETQPTAFLTTSDVPFTANGGTFTTTGRYNNGYITVRVLTDLSAPVAVAPIDCMVFARAADNFELADPTNPPVYLSRFVAQSAEVEEAEVQIDSGEKQTHIMRERNRLHHGELVASLRPLLRRSQYLGAYTSVAPTTTSLLPYSMGFAVHKLPPAFGYDPAGEFTANQIVGVGTAPFNFVNLVPLAYILPSFVAYRGSTIWTFNTNSDKPISHLTATRSTDPTPNVSSYFQAANSSVNAVPRLAEARMLTASSGTAITNQYTQAGLTVELPNLTNYRFQSTDPRNATNPLTGTAARVDGSAYDVLQVQLYENPTVPPGGIYFHRYIGIGTDFNAHFFLNVPTYHQMGSLPSAP